MSFYTLHDKTFGPYLSADDIAKRVEELGKKITNDYKGGTPTFLIVLNGAFMFASDLLKNIDLTADVQFVRVSSYEGTGTTGKVRSLLGITAELEGKDVVLIEDIVDTGITLDYLYTELKNHKPATVKIASLLFKKEAYQKSFPIDYVGFEIPNNFVVGYGLDYDGLGRNINEILTLKDTE